MYKAIEVIPKSSASRLVSADEINERFHGDVPRMIHFVCPYCNRPVNAAMGGAEAFGGATVNGREYSPKHEDRLRYTRIALYSPDTAMPDVHMTEALERTPEND